MFFSQFAGPLASTDECPRKLNPSLHTRVKPEVTAMAKACWRWRSLFCRLGTWCPLSFGGFQVIILVACLEEGKQITGACCEALPESSRSKLKNKRPELARQKGPLHRDKLPFQKSTVTMTKLQDLASKLVPCSYFILRICPVRIIAVRKFWSTAHCKEVFAEWYFFVDGVNDYFGELNKTYFSHGMEKVKIRWIKSTALDSDYGEK